MNKELLNSKEASKYLSIPLRTLQQLSKQGKIKAIKVGKQWKYKRSDIEKYLQFGTDFSTEPARKPDNFTQPRKERIEFIERRAYPRINSNFRCQYSINLPPFKEINNEGIIKNLSAGGIFLISQDREMNNININDPIDLDLSLINKDKTINIKTEGRIVRKNSIGLGIKFRNIDEETRNKIIQYVG